MRSFSSFLSASLAFLLAVGPMTAQSSEGGVASDFEIRVVESDGAAMPAGSHTAKGFTVQVVDGSGAPVADAAVVLRLPEAGPTGSFADGSHSAVAYTDGAGKAHISNVQWSAESGSFTIKITATKGVVHAGTLFEETLSSASGPSKPLVVQPVPVQAPVVSASSVPTPNAPPLPSLPSAAPTAPPPSPGTPATPSSSPLPSARIAPAIEANPSVSVTNNMKGEKVHSGSGKTKWIIIAAVAAGAGVGVAMMGGHGKKSTPAATPGVTIGSPTVSVGAP